MNVTELARILRITPQELRQFAPQLGFDIGAKAIKVNQNVANKIIKGMPTLKRQIEEQRKIDERIKKEKEDAFRAENKKTVLVPKYITVRDFSAITGVAINLILGELMKNGIFASLNEKIDYDTAWLAGSELGIEVKPEEEKEEVNNDNENKLRDILAKEGVADMLSRPPVIVVMGHVDHGKTKLLDAIRSTNVIGGEAGGITQHIGAYQVVRKNQLITFIDTPGHEAFTAMRSRGAKIADVAILVVAADDGVKPQTVEAFKIIKAAKIPFVVAINKVDKADANVDKVKQELSTQLGITPEDWGGKTICSPISALKNTGIAELLDMVLLTAETEAEDIKANPNADAAGTIIESNVSKEAGPIATILIQNGTLRTGDQLTLNGINVGKVRRLNNYLEQEIKEAGPATPVQIIGLKISPQVGDILEVGDGERIRHRKDRTSNQNSSNNVNSVNNEDEENIKKLNLIVKSDVLGSAEAIEESLAKINSAEVKSKIIHKGLGNITDGDIKKAEATGAIILGFNIKVLPNMAEIAREKNVEIKTYSIIYDLINFVKEKLEDMIEPVIIRKDLGRLKVLAVFRTEKDAQIIGGKVLDAPIESDATIEVYRNKEMIASGKMKKLQAGKQNVTIVEADQECGIEYAGKPVIEVGDVLNFYKEEVIKKKIK
ncbi:MAG: translation initiation factor IF-2 [Candidatus Magasanikbacteria bacterium]|nr:translation initiation factor IF-2 [Candidatus Magasanikbacteria bacterium]